MTRTRIIDGVVLAVIGAGLALAVTHMELGVMTIVLVVIVSLAVVVGGHRLVMMMLTRRHRQRFVANREPMTIDEIYHKNYAAMKYDEGTFARMWRAAGQAFGVDYELLRPEDPLSAIEGPWSEPINADTYYLFAKAIYIMNLDEDHLEQGYLKAIKTLDDFVKAFLGPKHHTDWR